MKTRLLSVLAVFAMTSAAMAATVTTSVYSDAARGSVTGGGEYADDANVVLTATAAEGYVFYRWNGDVPAEQIYDNPLTLDPGSYEVEAHFIKPVYVSNASTAETPDGTSWETAYPTLAAAVTAAKAGITDDADRVIFVSQGFYITTATIGLSATTAIFASFPGKDASEVIKDRSLDLYPTYFAGSTNDIVYKHVSPKYGQLGFYETNTVVQVFTGDGRINPPPAHTGEHDIYVYSKYVTRNQFFGLNAGCNNLLVDGVYFTAREHFISMNKNNGNTLTVRNCKIHGIYSGSLNNCSASGGSGYISVFENCDFAHCTAAYGKQHSTAWRNCTFRDHWRWSGALIYQWYSNFLWEDCTFARVGNYNADLFTQEGAMNILFNRCVFTNCIQMSTSGANISLVSTRAPTSSIQNCYFENNYQEVNPGNGKSHILIGHNNGVGGQEQPIENCYFGYNKIVAPKNEVDGTFAIGIVGTSNAQRGTPIINCTFLSNEVSYVENDMSEVTAARGVIISSNSSGNTLQAATIANCTFLGPSDDIADIAQYGTWHAKNSYLINSIITRTGLNSNPFQLSMPAYFHIINSSIGNLDVFPEGMTYTGLETTPVPLELIEDEATGMKALRPTALMPGLTNSTSDVAYNTKGTYRNSFRYRKSIDSPWERLISWEINVSGYNNKLASTDATTMLIGDAFGNPRTLGSFTRGAIQPLTEQAIKGFKLTVKAEPITAAYFEVDTTQALLADEYSKPVTPVASDGVTFSGWYTENGELYSNSETLPAMTLTKDLVLIAKYTVPNVNIIFDLKDSGKFVDNNSSTITLSVPAGSNFPAVPEFVESDYYHFEGWSEEFPDLVPFINGSVKFTAEQVTKAWRNFHLVQTADIPKGSDLSGDSWANATDDITAMHREASRYRGRLLFKHGTYTVPKEIPLLANVHFIGGFDGTEENEVPNDPDRTKTIITGNSKINGFAYHGGQVTNSVFQNLTMEKFTDRLMSLVYSQKEASHLTFKNMVIQNIGNVGSGNSTIDIYGTIDFEDSEINTCARAIRVMQTTVTGGTITNRVHNTRFIGNRNTNTSGYTSRAPLWLATYDPIEVTECYFNKNYHSHYDDSVCIRLGGSGYARIADCVFDGNYASGNCSRFVYNNGKSLCIIEGCAFIGNYTVNGDHVDDPNSTGIYIYDSALTIIRDTLFRANTNTLVNSSSSAAITRTGTGKTIVQNCTFEDNVIKEQDADKVAGIIFTSGNNQSKNNYMAIVNCAFKGNVVPTTTSSTAQLSTTAVADGTFAIVNTLIENDPEKSPVTIYYPTATHVPTVVNSAIENIDPVAYTNFNNNYISKLYTTEVTYKGHTDTEPAHLTQSATSVYAAAGVPVYQGNNNLLYIYTPEANAEKPYLELTSKTTRLSVEDAAKLNLTLIPDALGVRRRPRRVTLGPVQAPNAHTVMTLQ